MRVVAAALALLIGAPSIATAQLRGIRAEVTPVVESAVQPGGRVRAALLVKLPERFHVQSNAPRDPAFIPTVLTVDFSRRRGVIRLGGERSEIWR